jgi:hypothetical protein
MSPHLLRALSVEDSADRRCRLARVRYGLHAPSQRATAHPLPRGPRHELTAWPVMPH